ncbi:negative transcriptional regulator, PaiB family [Shimia gijangensis]|uniref:Negative transcriptional regulator, PaiB family n=1 Tax=Shimia gijangensis TaxID=1470563 RepID=A0A1M6RNX5_9RHOB|nr:FMN-binding negative transcriptional regulator [Shimia gijangensis]SHK34159.1 negative transcriptional regulator, PaiB family [Shimia gijangensis]
MHPNPTFRESASEENLAFARERGFGMLAVNGAEVPMISHVPFLLSEDGRHIDLHLVRSNPISRTSKDTTPATIAISGPDSYVSPDWYGVEDQVPTWNYVAVHLTGTLKPLPDSELLPLLERLSHAFEERLDPKPIWHHSKMDAAVLSRMIRMIRPFRMEISDVQGTWKLGQNNSDTVRLTAADHVAAFGIGSDNRLLAAMMQTPTGKKPQ